MAALILSWGTFPDSCTAVLSTNPLLFQLASWVGQGGQQQRRGRGSSWCGLVRGNFDGNFAMFNRGTSGDRTRSWREGAGDRLELTKGGRVSGTLKVGGVELDGFFAKRRPTEGGAADRGDAAYPKESSSSSSRSSSSSSTWEVRDKGNKKERRGRGVGKQQGAVAVGEIVAVGGSRGRGKIERPGRPSDPSAFGSERAAAGIGCCRHRPLHPYPQIQHHPARRQQGARFLGCGGTSGVRHLGTGVVMSGSRGDGAEAPASAAVPSREPTGDRGGGRGAERGTEEQRAARATVDEALFEEPAGEEQAPPLSAHTAAVGAERSAATRAGDEQDRRKYARRLDDTMVTISPEPQHQPAQADTAGIDENPGRNGKGGIGSFGLEPTPGVGGEFSEGEAVGPIAESYERGRWLLGLLVLQSTSSSVLDKYQDLLREHVVVTLFLTMLVGAGGNAGNQSAIKVIRGLATGRFTADAACAARVLGEQAIVGLLLGTALAAGGFLRVWVTDGTTLRDAGAISTSLFLIVMVSVMLGSALPFGFARAGVDPAHAGTTIQVAMDIVGVAVTCVTCSFVLMQLNEALILPL